MSRPAVPRARLALAAALLLAACAGPARKETQRKTPGEDVPMGSYSGTGVIDRQDGVHGSVPFVDGWKEGREQLWYANGSLARDCTWKHGRASGTCRNWRPNGKLGSEWIFDESAGTASFREWSDAGSLVRAGSTRDGKLDGPYQSWFDDGAKACAGAFRGGGREGPWQYWNQDGSIDEQRSGLFQADQRAGPLPESERAR